MGPAEVDAIRSPFSPRPTLRRLPQFMNTELAPKLSPRSALPDLENPFGDPFGDAGFQAQSTTQSSTGISRWSAPTGINSLSMTYVHQPSVADAQPTETNSNDEDLGSLFQGLPKDAKIGLIVGIVVIVSLSLVGCGMCFLDCKRRQHKRRERRQNREAELVMLEMEMRDGQTTDQQRRAKVGLWDHLKPASGERGVNVAGDTSANVRRDSTIESSRSDSVASRPQAIPRDRVSIVSSVPSVISSVGQRPALPRSFLNGGVRA